MSDTSLDLKHNIGGTLQLQFTPGNADDRYYVKLIGYLEDKSLVVTTPRMDGSALKIQPDQKFIIRMISGNAAQGFTATAMHSTSRPYPHMHLTYPKDLQSITVRKAERVNCKLIVTVQNVQEERSMDEGVSASMEDISTAGSQLNTLKPLGEKGDTISIKSKISVAGMEQYLTISGIIRRVVEPEEEGQSFEYGIEFVLLEDNDKLLLHGFVYEQMTKD
ncbi:MAG: flagellar brake protein [Woeseiaceae bacterium]